jgi:hypothetical protein
MNQPEGECEMNYRWEQCYEMNDGVYWAIVDDDSQAEGMVSSHLLVVNHCWAESLGVPFQENEFPKRIVQLLNAGELLEYRATELEKAYREGWADGAANAPKFAWQDGQVDIDWGQSETCSKLTKQG